MDNAIKLQSDVLVLGGGPAGTWAACAAAAEGAGVVLADKGRCGTSGAAAAAGVQVWYVPPDPDQREYAMRGRESLGGYLADRSWMARVLDETYRRLPDLEAADYPFPRNDAGELQRFYLHGPEYMRCMRRRVVRAGVRVLDHCPALELLVDSDGVIVGAHGLRRQSGGTWEVRANAIVIATGGCAFRSGALGCHVNTGDGQLMAVEAGAELSGMEFSNSYGLAHEGCSVTKNAFFVFASFVREDGTDLATAAAAQNGQEFIAKALTAGPVYARLDQASEQQRKWIRATQPNFLLPFDRLRINPFEEWFPVSLIFEGTVRGTGGLRLADGNCMTTIPGVFAAGDAASREFISGGFSGGGAHNAAWSISSGTWAGRAAARYACSRSINRDGSVRRALDGWNSNTSSCEVRSSLDDIQERVRAEVMPLEKNFFRSGPVLRASLEVLNQCWSDIQDILQRSRSDILRCRETVAMVATARWMYVSALAREESRGMHKRTDYPEQWPETLGRRYLYSGGLDAPWAAFAGTEIAGRGAMVQ